ncbi:MAG TPA: symmetrical bis(5'-nucleosyl)-tetraphosphatase [Steroidobacteraceae bacterium]|nr:symmetrical bis(5'-nucleosyl)-tetraphosphatase [Steroidobacteraceae bacterium]
MPRYAIGDVQGCFEPLRQLLRDLRFSADRDELVFAGDLVNRGPDSLKVLRHVRALADNARTVLGNHDLHLLAHHFDPARPLREGDTLQQVLEAPDREALLDWLLARPLLILDATHGDLFVHAGLIPQWTVPQAQALAAETERALRATPREFLARMYGNQPDRWREGLTPEDRGRFTINVLTRLRYCSADGTINLKLKDAPQRTPPPWLPWYAHADRASAAVRVVFGHWSTLGLLRRKNLLALDTGCVWGGTLTAVNLDDPEAPPVQVPCAACQQPGAD